MDFPIEYQYQKNIPPGNQEKFDYIIFVANIIIN